MPRSLHWITKTAVLAAMLVLFGAPRSWAEPPAAGSARAEHADRGRPNIVFILADDWGWGDLGCYGHRRIKTPNLDRLARQGIRFSQFYVCSGVCSPSRTAFMTGHFPARHRIHGHLARPDQNARRGMPNYLDPNVPMVTRLLQASGYATAHFGKWHLGDGEGAPLPSAYGIDKYITRSSNEPGWAGTRNSPTSARNPPS